MLHRIGYLFYLLFWAAALPLLGIALWGAASDRMYMDGVIFFGVLGLIAVVIAQAIFHLFCARY